MFLLSVRQAARYVVYVKFRFVFEHALTGPHRSEPQVFFDVRESFLFEAQSTLLERKA